MPFNALFSWWIKKRMKDISHGFQNPVSTQENLFNYLISKGKKTSFGQTFDFNSIRNHKQFSELVPLTTYESLTPYINQIQQGDNNVLWPEEIKWFAKSSGTTNSKSKLIPITKEAIYDCHYKGGKDLLSIYHSNNPNANLFGGKHLILGGNSSLNQLNEQSQIGDLSAIIIKNLPFWTEIRRTPSKSIALMENWDEKISKMAKAVIKENVTILAGVPSWMLVLLKEVLKQSGKNNLMEVWPNLQFYMHGGVNFEPYKAQFEQLIQNPNLNYYQTYNASEGFFGLQTENKADDMNLLVDNGIYYEFIPMDKFNGTSSKAISLKDVKPNINYALVITTNTGLWRYIIGDTVKFTSTQPYKIKVTGRTKHFINAFGEELIIENTDKAIQKASTKTNSSITDYTVAPIYQQDGKSGAHQWLIEFEKKPQDITAFNMVLDQELKNLNSDYEAKRSHDLILNKPNIKVLKEGTFHKWLESKNKMGGQNKIPRLSNNRTFVEEIINLV